MMTMMMVCSLYFLLLSFTKRACSVLKFAILSQCLFVIYCDHSSQFTDEILNAMGSARLEIMDERDEDKERETPPQKTVTQSKVHFKYLTQ